MARTIIILFGVALPRVALLLMLIFTNWFTMAFKYDPLWVIAGLFFLPFTTLAYTAIMLTRGSITDYFCICLLVTAAVDLTCYWYSVTGRGRGFVRYGTRH